jgi:hypothetical protein
MKRQTITGASGDVKVLRTNFGKGGRILWERAVSFSARISAFTEVIRVW